MNSFTSPAPAVHRASAWLSPLLSINGGFVDAASYLTLKGLFSSHVTGNFVTLGAAVVNGTSGTFAKLVALPTFCAVVMGARLAGHAIRSRGGSAFNWLLGIEVALLALAAVLSIQGAPFGDVDAPLPLSMGELLVAAMAIQNAVHRVHLPSAPPSTVMTGTTTQLMLDVTDWLGSARPAPPALTRRIRDLLTAVVTFAVGCAAAALAYSSAGRYCFIAPPVIGALCLMLRARNP
jgi:uncharacterized membrane protein YoaK (UPF0700 family)